MNKWGSRKWYLYHYTTIQPGDYLGWQFVAEGSLKDMRERKGTHPHMAITSRKIDKP
jgi:hypothetical protein